MDKYIQSTSAIVWLLISWLLSGCGHTIEPATAFSVTGTYQLVSYKTSTLSDDSPVGEVIITQFSSDHITIAAKGTSGKTKISYSYSDVLVESAGQNSFDQDAYRLLYKGRQIGVAGNDGISQYVDLYPSSGITLEAIEF